MKNLTLLLFIALVVISCGKEETKSESRDCQAVEYDTSFELQLDDEVCFPDGNSFILTDIEHAFCPCYGNCLWEDGLFITLSMETETYTLDKKYTSNGLDPDRSIFTNFEISTLSYSLGTGDETIPCIDDFEPEKVKLTLTISPI